MPGGAAVVWMPGGVPVEIHLTAKDTNGAFCLLVDRPPVGWSLPAHRHHNEAETIHIVDGLFTMEIDGRQTRLSAGETVHVPAGVSHSSANIGQETGQRVLLFSPAGMERFFLEAGAATPHAAESIDPSDVVARATRYGWEFS